MLKNLQDLFTLRAFREGSPALRLFLEGNPEWESFMELERSMAPWLDAAFAPKSKKGLAKVASCLAKGPIPRTLAEFLAEDLVREFLIRGEGSRSSVYLKEFKEIITKAEELYRILNGTGLYPRFSIGCHFTAETPLGDLPFNKTVMISNSYCAHFEGELHAFLMAAKYAMETHQANPDKGGVDGRQRAAQTGLGLIAKHTLNSLGLKSGSGPGGYLSQFLCLVNEAATGKLPDACTWADKASARASREFNRARQLGI